MFTRRNTYLRINDWRTDHSKPIDELDLIKRDIYTNNAFMIYEEMLFENMYNCYYFTNSWFMNKMSNLPERYNNNDSGT